MGGLQERQGRVLAAVVAALVISGVVEADLKPFPQGENGPTSGLPVRASSVHRDWAALDSVPTLPSLEELTADSVGLPAGGTGEHRPVQILVDRSNSFELCLYALIGLGVFRSCHWVRRSSLGFIPEWYHSGAPRQIGHSLAVGPDAFCFAAACLIQPGSGADSDAPRQRPGAIMARWRRSQFTPCVLAARAPPQPS